MVLVPSFLSSSCLLPQSKNLVLLSHNEPGVAPLPPVMLLSLEEGSWGRSWYFKYGSLPCFFPCPLSTSKLFKFDTYISFHQIELTLVGERRQVTHICDTLSCSRRNGTVRGRERSKEIWGWTWTTSEKLS